MILHKKHDIAKHDIAKHDIAKKNIILQNNKLMFTIS